MKNKIFIIMFSFLALFVMGGLVIAGTPTQSSINDGVSWFKDKLGIGTNNPEEKLHVIGNSKIEGTIVSENINNSGIINNGGYNNINMLDLDNDVPSNMLNRTLFTTNDMNLYVPSEYNTIQDAINEIPLYIRHPIRIYIDNGVYNEDLLIPTVILDRIKIDSKLETEMIIIIGNNTNPELVSINSITAQGVNGVSFKISGFNITNTSPYDNENCGVCLYGGQTYTLVDSVFSGGDIGLLAYGASVDVNGVNWGNNVLNTAIKSKEDSRIMIKDNPSTGSVNEYAYDLQDGYISTDSNTHSINYGISLINPIHDSWGLYDRYQNKLYGIDIIENGLKIEGEEGLIINGNFDSNGYEINDFGLIKPRNKEKVINNGNISITNCFDCEIDTEGNAATDNLDYINDVDEGTTFRIRTSFYNRDITIRHNVGNIYVEGKMNCSLNSEADFAYCHGIRNNGITCSCVDALS